MSNRKHALAGVVFVAFALVATFMVPAPPATDAAAAQFGDWFRDNHATAAAAAYIQVVGTVFLLWWAGTLWHAMRRAENGEPRLAVVAFAGLALATAMTTTAAAVTATTALRVDDLTDPGVKIFSTLSFTLFAIAAVPIAAHIGAVSVLAARTTFLPRWLARLGGLIALLALVGGVAVTSDAAGLAAIAFAAFLAWLLWIVCVSVVLARGDAEPATTEEEPPSVQSEPAAPTLP
jgi:hypothetical protein